MSQDNKNIFISIMFTSIFFGKKFLFGNKHSPNINLLIIKKFA